MPFNTLGQYSPSHKVWDHVGNILPDIELSEGQRPAFPFKPAAWLPVQFYDKHYENWNVVMPGKMVALDPDGRVMPAEYGLTGATVAYTASDVTAGTIDVATGEAVTIAKTVTLSQLNGVREAGWTAALAGVAAQKTSGFMGRFGSDFVDATAKYPIGVAPYAYLQWAGGDGFNPAEFNNHNYNMQHQVAVLCDYVIRLPLIPGQVTTETVDKTVTGSALVIGTQATFTKANSVANATGRYNATYGAEPLLSTDTVIALCLDEFPIAKNTARTTIAMESDNTADDVSGVLVNEQSSVSSVDAAGDFYVDTAAGVIFIYSADSAALPTSISGAGGTVSIEYYHYATAPGVYSQFSCVLATTSELKPGDFLECGAASNWVRANPAPGTSNCSNLMGQVLGFESEPSDALDRVRTGYSPALNTSSAGSMANATAGSASANLGQMDQMPGSASQGYTDLVTFAGAADTLVVINVISR